ncbi:hypothetical protein C8F01DRAFT_1153281 [Mycena amicta]|nr:hypothetical protein C8F01DRAFT_1153281 [Mycena amicta]
MEVVDEKPRYEDEEALRRRIADLENELQAAQTATEEAEVRLENTQNELKHSEHARHAARNLASYGHSDHIIFVHPEDMDQGLIYRMSKGEGARATVCRFMVRYNIDQFLQRPTLHSWLQNGKLFREATELQSSRFELFFDLLFVGMVHQLSEAAAEEPTGLGFANYVLTFAPAFSIWSDIRDMANQFANDDVTQRAYILWTMLLLVGYSNNASSIQFRREESLGSGEGEGSATSFEANLTSLNWAIGFFVVAKLSRALLSLVYAAFLPLSRRPLIFAACNPAFMAILTFIGIFTPIHVTIILVVVAIVGDFAIRFLGIVLYKTFEALGKKYDRIRKRKLGSDYDSCPGSSRDPDKTIEDPAVLEGLRTMNSSSTAVDEQPPMAMGELKMCRKLAARETLRLPAINIEHHVERLGAFVTVVLGEMVVSVFFASRTSVGLNMESGRAMLSLMVAFNFNWLYFDSAVTKHFVHAIRRHWIAGYFFTLLHLPLCMSLLLASAAVNALVTSNRIDPESGGGGLKWFFGAGLGVSLCIMATIGALHRNLDNKEGITESEGLPIGTRRWKHHNHNNHHRRKIPRMIVSRRIVIGFRYVAGIAMCLVPLASHLSSIRFLSIYVGITALLIVEETFARIEKREQELDVEVVD